MLAFAVLFVQGPQGARGEINEENSDDYVLRVWEMEDGLPTNTVTGIAQTPDGYSWVGYWIHHQLHGDGSFE